MPEQLATKTPALSIKQGYRLDMCLLCLCACLFYMCFGSPAGKELTSWLSFVVSICEFATFPLGSWVRCGTWLYRFLIFAHLLTSLARTAWWGSTICVLMELRYICNYISDVTSYFFVPCTNMKVFISIHSGLSLAWIFVKEMVNGCTTTPNCIFILIQFWFKTGIQNGQFKLSELPLTHFPVLQLI